MTKRNSLAWARSRFKSTGPVLPPCFGNEPEQLPIPSCPYPATAWSFGDDICARAVAVYRATGKVPHLACDELLHLEFSADIARLAATDYVCPYIYDDSGELPRVVRL